MIPEIHIKDYNYPLPDERIAKYPLPKRDSSKLLKYNEGRVSEHIFKDLPELLPENSHAGALFAFYFTEFPALLLFTLAHRYLGLSSMLFAAGSGIVFRYAYLKLTRVFHPAFSITLVAAVHGLWNIGVYYYLWGHSAAA